MSTAPAPASAQAPGAAGGPGKPGQQAPPSPPFRCGTQNTTNLDGYQVTVTPGAAQQVLANYEPSVNSFMRGAWVQVAATAAGNAATVVFAGDGPSSFFAQVAFLDTQQRPIIQVTGYQLAQIINKFGGYFIQGDPRGDVNYLATAGSGASGGSFFFTVWVPLEINHRTGVGSALNKNSSQTYTLSLTVATSASIYTTAPTTVPAATVTIFEDGWWQPQAMDVSGAPASQAPPAPNTWSYWLQSTYTGLNGSVQEQMTTGLGNSIRAVAFNTYDTAASTRAAGETDFPNTVQLIYKGTNLKNWTKTLWKTLQGRAYGLTSTTADTAYGPENGVYMLWQFMQDFTMRPGDGLNYALLNTDQGDQFQLLGSFNASATLYELVNYLATVGNPSVLRQQR